MKEGENSQQAVHELIQALRESAPKDSFNLFKTGLQQNWIFVIAIVSVSLWLINGMSDSKNVNQVQDKEISEIQSAQKELTMTVSTLANTVNAQNFSQQSANSQILNKVELIQKDIEIIKNKE